MHSGGPRRRPRFTTSAWSRVMEFLRFGSERMSSLLSAARMGRAWFGSGGRAIHDPAVGTLSARGRGRGRDHSPDWTDADAHARRGSLGPLSAPGPVAGGAMGKRPGSDREHRSFSPLRLLL